MTLMVHVTRMDLWVHWQARSVVMPWPVLLPSSWLHVTFTRTNGGAVLNGHTLGEEKGWRSMLATFWDRYRAAFPQHAVFNDFEDCLDCCLPFLLHGDEGRGKLRRCVLVTSVQPLLHQGGHSFMSRLLFSILPGENYGAHTLDEMQLELVADLLRLYRDGFEVTQLRCSCIHVLSGGYA